MSILHRILVSKHKHKRAFVRRKVAYKKFIGLKTFKNVLCTKLSVKDPKPVHKKKQIIKKTPRKAHTQIVFPRFSGLTALQRRHEAILAGSDVANFRAFKETPAGGRLTEEKFQAFLPQNI